MFLINCFQNKAWIEQKETLTQYSKGNDTVKIRLSYSQEWDDLNKIAVFRAYDTQIDVAVGSDEIEVPVQVLLKADVHLFLGLFGISNTGDVVIPTVWADLGIIQPSPNPTAADNYGPPALDLYAQVAALVEDARAQAAVAVSGVYASSVTFSLRVSDGHMIMTVDDTDTDLGPVSAYAVAVSAGYAGTYNEFKQLLIANGRTASAVEEALEQVEAVTDVAAAAQTAAQAANSTASDALTVAYAAQTAAQNAVTAVNSKQTQHLASSKLLASGADTWSIGFTGVTANNLVIWSPAPDSLENAASVNLRLTAQAANTLTFAADDTTTNDITVNIAVFN